MDQRKHWRRTPGDGARTHFERNKMHDRSLDLQADSLEGGKQKNILFPPDGIIRFKGSAFLRYETTGSV